MRQILTPFLAVHWLAAFAAMAGACVLDAEGAKGAVLAGLLGDHSGGGFITPWTSAALAVAFSVTAALFLWVFVTALLVGSDEPQEAEEVSRYAFGAAVGSLTALCLARAMGDAALLGEGAVLTAALAASYAAICAERWSTPAPVPEPEMQELQDAARLMAASAGHNSMLARISGRPGTVMGDR
ncbi:hypothetical protein GA830_13380 [Mesorhizobium sp. NBSH29]|uniref:hypothetical protein n=1 Tax=Mesorhizobium sp. NBSH29 TaxID=2654249 RepID=UPI0018966A40|nr:hypothetical protein [Mesorhizobium sp. NBSH29]QPC87628.1 hypothetical protein GA830_13380 [Mesorhizobium sp. NBSH29]